MPDPYRPPAEPPTVGNWRDQAACRGADQELFFADGSHGIEAKAICRTCPVQAECLEYALAHDERFGVWGGLTPNQRRDLTRARRRERNQCQKGHDLTRVGRWGNDRCAQCAREWNRAYKERRRIATQNQHTATNRVGSVRRDRQNDTETTRGQNREMS